MSVYVDQMFNATATATALTLLNSGITATAGNYAPLANGRLLKVTIMLSGQAATSLLEAVRVEINATSFNPNLMRFGNAGAGVRTAPAFPINVLDWPVDQAVQTQLGITGNYLFNVAAITPNLQVFGTFYTLP